MSAINPGAPTFCSKGRNCYENCGGWNCTCACHCSSDQPRLMLVSDHEQDLLFQIKIARDQALCDAVKEVERLYDEWWDIDRRRWLNVVLERLKALTP